MITVQVRVVGHELSLINAPIISSDSVEFDCINFSFDETWNLFKKIAVFWGSDDDTPYGSLVDDDGNAMIPTAVLEDKATIRFGVFGEDPEDLLPRITSTILKYKIKEGAWSDSFYGDDEATPSLVDQLRVLAYSMADESHRFIDESTENYEEFTAQVNDQIEDATEETIPPLVTSWLNDHVNPQSQVVIDDSLSIEGAAADAKAAGDAVTDLKSALNYNKTATPGYLLRATNDANGSEWSAVGLPTDEQTAQAVSDWLDAHPEATTTVQDGSLTEAKFSNQLKLSTIKDYITPEMFGAKGDGITDDTIAFKNMIDSVNSGDVIIITKGTYIVNPILYGAEYWKSAIDLYDKHDISIFMSKGVILQSVPNDNGDVYSAVFNITNCTNILVYGGEIIGTNSEYDYTNHGSRRQYGLIINNSSDITIDGCVVHGCVASAIHVGGSNFSNNVKILNCKCYDTYYHGISIEGANDVYLYNVTAYGAYHTNYSTSIDIEGISAESPNNNIRCVNCNFGDSNTASVSLHKNNNVVLSGCELSFVIVLQSGDNISLINCSLDDILVDRTPKLTITNLSNCIIKGNILIYSSQSDSATFDINFNDCTIFSEMVRVWMNQGNVSVRFNGCIFYAPALTESYIHLNCTNTLKPVYFIGCTIYVKKGIDYSVIRCVQGNLTMKGNEIIVKCASTVTTGLYIINASQTKLNLQDNHFEIDTTAVPIYFAKCASNIITTIIGNIIEYVSQNTNAYAVLLNSTDEVTTANNIMISHSVTYLFSPAPTNNINNNVVKYEN